MDPIKPSSIAEDKNAKRAFWNSRSPNKVGCELFSYICSSDFTIIAPITSTHYPDRYDHRPDIQDIDKTKNKVPQYKIQNLEEHSLDQNPVQLVLYGRPIMSPWPNSKMQTNWNKFSTDLHTVISNPNPILSNTEELDEAVDFLTASIQEQCSVQINKI